jgi:hypothetical protein
MPHSHFNSLPGVGTGYKELQKKLLLKSSGWLQLWDNTWRDFRLAGNDLDTERLFADTDDFKTNVKREVKALPLCFSPHPDILICVLQTDKDQT